MTFIDYYLEYCDFLLNTANFINTFQSKSVTVLSIVPVRFFCSCEIWVCDERLNPF